MLQRFVPSTRMNLPFAIIAGVTVGSAIAAMSMRNLVHCALSLVVTFGGMAALFLQLHAEFIGLVQILVYVGAVAILIVFAILLTRGAESPTPAPIATSPVWGVMIALAAFVTIGAATLSSVSTTHAGAASAGVSVKRIGEKLVTDYVLPLEVLGLLLTAAAIGAVIIALQERKAKP